MRDRAPANPDEIRLSRALERRSATAIHVEADLAAEARALSDASEAAEDWQVLLLMLTSAVVSAMMTAGFFFYFGA